MNTQRNTTRLLTGSTGLALAVSGLLAPTAAGAATPACTNVDLTASYHRHDAGAGHTYGWIAVKNTSGHACHTGGYGGISYVGNGDGTQIGAPAVRVEGTVATYVLRPGQQLRSPIDETTAQNYPRKKCRPVRVDGFRIYVPNATKSQYVKHATIGCRNHHVKLIHQRPYRRP